MTATPPTPPLPSPPAGSPADELAKVLARERVRRARLAAQSDAEKRRAS